MASRRWSGVSAQSVAESTDSDVLGQPHPGTINGVTTEFALYENTAYTRILGEVRSDGGEWLDAYRPEGFTAQQAIGGEIEHPLLDGLGSVRQLIDAAGTVILSWDYEAYGRVSPSRS